MFRTVVNFIRETYRTNEFIPLHTPTFAGNEKEYLGECIDTTFVSSVGKFVDKFENITAEYTGAKHAVVCVNGTNALHMALLLAGVQNGDEVITQPLSFIATCNAISYLGAHPIFVDVDLDTLGLSPQKLEEFLLEFGEIRNDGACYNKTTGRKIAACVPMHTFGHPVKLDELSTVCSKYNISIIEDAAESMGSKYKNRHTGTFGLIGILSYNGNKIITTGGGGMLLTDNDELAKKAKHLTTQAKVPHPWEFVHDHIGYNYRMPNINAALGCAQMEQLDLFVSKKRELATKYLHYFETAGITFVKEPENCSSNYWLNAVILENSQEKNNFLEFTNKHKVMTRPVWQLMNKLPMFKDCQTDTLENASWLEDRLVNIPSTPIL